MATETMDDILSEKPAPAEAPASEAPAPESEAPEQAERPSSKRKAHAEREATAQGKVRDPDTGQFRTAEPAAEAPAAPPEAPAPAAPAAPAPQEFTAREKAFLLEAQGERVKRQAAEAKLLAQSAPKEPEKTFWEDPEGALARQQASLAEHKQATEQAVLNMRLSTAETIARSKYQDFDARIEIFKELVTNTPGLVQQWLASPDPAEYAYKLGKSHMELKQAGSIDELRARIEKETRLKVEAEYADKAKKLEAERAAIPQSLTNARAAAAPSVVWGGPTSMKDILN